MAEGKQIGSQDVKWLRLLGLDGGGVRGLSSLMVLQQLMEAIDPNAPPKPCEYFHMIGGTSTGGLIAIMLGRLKMTVEECITAYTTLSQRVFEKQRHRIGLKGNVQGRFDTEALEQAVKQMLVQQGFNENELLKDSPDACKIFVCATSKHTADTVCLTSYQSPRGGSHLLNSVKIWEACRATSAATSFFDPIAIGPFKEEFIDGALGANNPVYALWNQAQDLWGGGPLQDKLLCLVSIGTGVPSLKPFRDNVLSTGKALIALSTQTEQTAEQFHRDKAALDDDGRYYRFNVSQGLEDIGLEESSKINEIANATSRYITSQAVFKQIKACTKKLSGQGYFIPNQIAFSIEGASVMSTPFIDLIALTAGTLAAVTRAADTLRSCQRCAARFKIADLSIASLHTECSTIRLGLHQIESVIARYGENALEDRFETYVLEEYDGVLRACAIPFSILNTHLEKIGLTKMREMNQSVITEKLHSVWSHQQMDMICQNIIGLARAISILCTAFQSETAIKTSKIMGSRVAKEVLANVSSDATSLHESFQTALEIEESAVSSMIGNEAFGFDSILINTTLYQKAFARQMIESQERETQDHDEKGKAILPMETPTAGPSVSKAPMEPRMPSMTNSNNIPNNPQFWRREPTLSFAGVPELEPSMKPGSLFETAASVQESSFTDFYSLDDSLPTKLRTNPATTAVEQTEPPEEPYSPALVELPPPAAVQNDEGSVSIANYIQPIIDESAAQNERRDSVDSQSSTDTISAIPWSSDNSLPQLPDESMLNIPKSEYPGIEKSLVLVSSPSATNPTHRAPPSSPPAKLSRLPTLFEVLSRRTLKPYELFDFYLYMRDIQKSVDYLDFWLDISQHIALCRHYVRELRRSVLMSDDVNDDEEISSVAPKNEINSRVARQDIRASAEKILYTYLLPGAEHEIILPHWITSDLTISIEEHGRDDPEVFQAAQDYVFQAMERDAFPGFLNLSRPLLRVFRRSKSLGPLMNRLVRRDQYVPPPTFMFSNDSRMQRVPPEVLFGSLGNGRIDAPRQ